MCKGGEVDFLMKELSLSRKEIFCKVRDYKAKATPSQLVGPENSCSWLLLDFVKYIYSLDFNSLPDYSILNSYLLSALRQINSNLNFSYEWN